MLQKSQSTSRTRRTALCVVMVGGTLLGLLSGPVSAHQQNGNPDPTNPANPVGGRHDVTVSKAVSLDSQQARRLLVQPHRG